MDRKLFRSLGLGTALAAGLTAGAASLPRPAHACGGFFCSSANPVNQAAEQIIFADNADGTVTAVIQIMYEGPANSFAWVLPVPGVPDVKVSSDQAFAALKAGTNPLYQLNTVFPGTCGMFASPNAGGSAGSAAPPSDSAGGPTVMVQAAGAVGPYDWTVISVDPDAANPAQAAIDWLAQNEYDIGDLGEEVLSPYLEENLNLIAFKLQKGNSSGAIRPVMLTYESALPSIPIRPTAVAANDDMGVMVWLLAASRGIPENYKALELNEALIDWFNPNNNYNEVVTRAADEAMGQGFVTEYADTTQNLINNTGISIFPDWQQQQWAQFSAMQFQSAAEMVQQASASWGGFDGFAEALQGAVTLPDTIAFDDFQRCINCYINNAGVVFDQTQYLTNLYEGVIKPMMDTQALLESRPYITRLYTTMSADEMTMDPVFDFNPDLDPVSNLHTADRMVECDGANGGGGGFTGPWAVELPQGDVVRGEEFGVWPIEIDSMPAALRILQYGTSGPGRVIEDRSQVVTGMMNEGGSSGGSAGRGGAGTGGRGGVSAGGTGGSGEDPGSMTPAGMDDDETPPNAEMASGDGCAAVSGRPAGTLSWIALALATLIRRRRKQD